MTILEQNLAEFDFDKTTNWSDDDWVKFRKWLLGLLENQTVTIIFFKKDGTIRKMCCTRNLKLIPLQSESVNKARRKENMNTISAYDLEVNGWRSFTVKNITKITV